MTTKIYDLVFPPLSIIPKALQASNTRAASLWFRAAWWMVVGLNVVLIVSGLWGFVMITTFNYDGLAAFNNVLLPATLLVIAAGPIKSLIKRRKRIGTLESRAGSSVHKGPTVRDGVRSDVMAPRDNAPHGHTLG